MWLGVCIDKFHMLSRLWEKGRCLQEENWGGEIRGGCWWRIRPSSKRIGWGHWPGTFAYGGAQISRFISMFFQIIDFRLTAMVIYCFCFPSTQISTARLMIWNAKGLQLWKKRKCWRNRNKMNSGRSKYLYVWC